GGDETLDRRCRRPQPQRDLFEFPAFAQCSRDRFRLAAVCIRVVKPAVARGQKLARGDKALLCEERRHETGERAAALMELDRWRAPRRESSRRLTAGE